MQHDLAQEKAALQRIWAKREKQIEKMSLSAVGLYGDVQGIVGASIPEIGELELSNLALPEPNSAETK
jgi:hypothetical protein